MINAFSGLSKDLNFFTTWMLYFETCPTNSFVESNNFIHEKICLLSFEYRMFLKSIHYYQVSLLHIRLPIAFLINDLLVFVRRAWFNMNRNHLWLLYNSSSLAFFANFIWICNAFSLTLASFTHCLLLHYHISALCCLKNYTLSITSITAPNNTWLRTTHSIATLTFPCSINFNL